MMVPRCATLVVISAAAAATACAHGSRFVYPAQIDPDRPVVAVVENAGAIDAMTSQAVAAAVGGREGVFTPEFVSSKRFARAHGGDARALDRLTDARLRRPVVLAVRTTRRDPQVVAGQDIRRVEVSWSVRVFLPLDPFKSEAFSLNAVGAGFSWDEAERQAVDRAATLVAERIEAFSNRKQP